MTAAPGPKSVHWGESETKIVENFKDHNLKFTQTREEYDWANYEYLTKSDEELEAEEAAEKTAAEAEAKSRTAPSRIVLYTLGILLVFQEIAGMSLPLGLSAWQAVPGYPEQGDCLKNGSHNFAEVDALLKMAVPTSWQGEAADSYTTANVKLMTLAQQMVDRDHEMERLVKKHAEHVTQTQLGLGAEQDILIAAYFLVRYLEASTSTLVMAYVVAYSAAVAAIAAGFALLFLCLQHAEHTVTKVHGVDYGDVINSAAEVGTTDQLTPAESAAPASGRNDSGDVSGGAFAASTSSDMPTAASSPNRPDSSRRAAVAPEPIAPSAPDQAAPIAARATPPSGHTANVAGSATPPNGRANQQSPQDPHADSEAAGHPGDVEDAGADAGTSGGERAPIETTAPDPELQQTNATASS